MTTKTFELGKHIWFALTISDGNVLDLQEHDMREGGSLSLEKDPIAQFLKCVKGRSYNTDIYVEQAKKWLLEEFNIST